MHALDVAVGEARSRDTSLVVAHAWTFPYPEPDPAPYDPYAQARRDAQAVLDAAVERATAAGVAVEGQLIEEKAGTALVHASKGADLLVVGSSGHGLSSVFGSVCSHVRHHASCPVLVVEPSA